MIGWQDKDGHVHRGSLFAAFAALADGQAWSFPALRPHQREPWHAFTVQVAAMALLHAGLDALPTGEMAWRDLLHGLTPGQPEAWELVVDDWSKPALLQPPTVAATDRAAYKNRFATPDALDMLVTAKNHDVKQERMAGASDEDWLFALVTLQTAAAYGGAKTYGVSRMNGKTGSRLITRVRPSGGVTASFQRDTLLLATFASEQKNLKSLVWIEPTNGAISLPITDFAPSFYIDCARRVRLVRNGRLEACYATSTASRIASEDTAGLTGDPYAPIKDTGDATVTPKRETFGYRGLSKILNSRLPVLGKTYSSDSVTGLSINISAIIRKGGTDTNTEGFFYESFRTSRWKDINTLGAEPLDLVAKVAGVRSDEAGEAGHRLRRALISLVQGGPKEPRFDDASSKKKVAPWLEHFDHAVTKEFFDAPFWNETARDPGNHRYAWRIRLRALADEIFERAAEAAPSTEVRRIKAKAQARAYFDRTINKWVEEARYGE